MEQARLVSPCNPMYYSKNPLYGTKMTEQNSHISNVMRWSKEKKNMSVLLPDACPVG